MSKKWIIILAVGLFALANIATFLIAQNRVRVVERVIYKDKPANVPATVVDNKPDKKAAVNNAIMPVRRVVNFDDSDRFVAGEAGSAAENAIKKPSDTSDKKVEISAPVKSETASTEVAVGVPVSGALNLLNGANTQTQYTITSVPEQPLNPTIPQKDIPMPQLPSLGSEYESTDNVDEAANAGLPQLPE